VLWRRSLLCCADRLHLLLEPAVPGVPSLRKAAGWAVLRASSNGTPVAKLAHPRKRAPIDDSTRERLRALGYAD
jgi:hypothetical protein